MAEFIIDMPDDYLTNEWGVYCPDERDDPMPIGEPIVRCRDCKCCDEEHYGAWGRVWHCEQFGDVKPDGFCAWPERRED